MTIRVAEDELGLCPVCFTGGCEYLENFRWALERVTAPRSLPVLRHGPLPFYTAQRAGRSVVVSCRRYDVDDDKTFDALIRGFGHEACIPVPAAY